MTEVINGARLDTVLVVGNPAPQSRTLELGRELAGRLTDELGGGGFETIDLAGLAPRLFGADRGDVIAAQARVAAADLLIVATPVYKASYTGLLKAFLDGLGPNALSGTIAVPLVVSASAAHALVGEVHLRPLLVELGATVPSRALTLTEAQLGDPSALIDAWAASATEPIARAVPVGAR